MFIKRPKEKRLFKLSTPAEAELMPRHSCLEETREKKKKKQKESECHMIAKNFRKQINV